MKQTLGRKQTRTRFAVEPAAKARYAVGAFLLAALLAAACISVLLGATPARAAGYTASIDPAVTWGTWQGWGCSLAWWANAFGGSQNAQELAAIVFSTSSTQFDGQTLPGLGMNIARYNLGAQQFRHARQRTDHERAQHGAREGDTGL